MESKKFISCAFVSLFQAETTLIFILSWNLSVLLSAILLSFVKFNVLDRWQFSQFINNDKAYDGR
ncbi:MAG TPA: hypothetical protein DEQ23_02995 [Chlorobium sp.]|nr:hypothetical protein [Chlorobium sp.]